MDITAIEVTCPKCRGHRMQISFYPSFLFGKENAWEKPVARLSDYDVDCSFKCLDCGTNFEQEHAKDELDEI